MAGGGLEAERGVRHTEGGEGAGDLGLDAADGLEGLDGVAAQVVVARGEREGEGVEDEVGRLEAVAVHGQVVDAMGDAHLPLDVAGLALLVDEQADDGGAVLLGQLEHPVEAGALGLAVLEVGRVEDGPAAQPLEAGLHHLGLGGVHHQGSAGLGGEALGDLVHVAGAVAADVVDAHVEDVRALLHLVLGHLHAGVPVALEERLPELLRAVGVGALADDEERRVLVERHEAVDRSGAGLVLRGAGRRREVATVLDHLAEVLGGGAAAAADDLHAQFGDEAGVVLDELLGGEVVVHLAVHHAGQAGVGQARDGHAGVLAEVAQVLAHLGGAGGAVEADHVGAHRVESGQRGGDLGAGQHAPGELHGDLHLEGYLATGGGHGPAGAVHGRLDAEQVEHGLDDEEVDAALEEGRGLGLEAVAQLGVADLAERGELGAGTHGPGDEAGPVGRGEAVRDLAGDAGRGHVDLVGPIGEAVLAEGHREAAEGVGLDDVHADVEVGLVELGHHVGAGDGQVLVAALEVGAAEVVGAELEGLQERPRGAVVHDHALVDQVQEARHQGRLPIDPPGEKGDTGFAPRAPLPQGVAAGRRPSRSSSRCSGPWPRPWSRTEVPSERSSR